VSVGNPQSAIGNPRRGIFALCPLPFAWSTRQLVNYAKHSTPAPMSTASEYL